MPLGSWRRPDPYQVIIVRLSRRSVSGYLHPAYAASLAEFGNVRALPNSGGWLLERQIRESSARDAMGLYPLFTCSDWSRLHEDLDQVGEALVSLVLVADPFGNFSLGELERCFPAKLLHFKDHHVVNLSAYTSAGIARQHRRNVQQALRAVEVEVAPEPQRLVADWVDLYGNLIARHGITGLSAFSPTSLAKQLEVPGLTVFCARHEGKIAGMVLFYEQDDVVYYHLGAYTDEGYDRRASYAVFARAIEHFADRKLAWLDLGAGAGLSGDAEDGLTRFKRGWATGVRPAYLCGRIFDRARYGEYARATGNQAAAYFPAYRKGEFG